MLLGDGCIYNGGVQRDKDFIINKYTGEKRLDDVFFCMNHSSQQQDYAIWKAQILNAELELRGHPNRCTYSKSKKVDKVTNKEYTGIYIKLRWAEYFRHLYPRIYKGVVGQTKREKDISYLLNQVYNDLHTAIWFMDDGNEKRKKRQNGKFDNPIYRLFTYSFGEKGNKIIQSWFKINYGVVPRILKDSSQPPNKQCYIVFSPEDSKKLFMKFAEYFCQIESMKKKFWLSFERYGLSEKVTPLEGEDIVHTV